MSQLTSSPTVRVFNHSSSDEESTQFQATRTRFPDRSGRNRMSSKETYGMLLLLGWVPLVTSDSANPTYWVSSRMRLHHFEKGGDVVSKKLVDTLTVTAT
ncbi:hypothetical protein AVEN_235235-1 [Araneus ventricosus]|uniref:Uncharacterized protein n=1 Tax=Araneus ventricosus TaxID=182803 RepID=A0A4Y2A3W1_ARAVE|nr:hypothetical protein AVEN_235235-1 [Araneus ventricosus]